MARIFLFFSPRRCLSCQPTVRAGHKRALTGSAPEKRAGSRFFLNHPLVRVACKGRPDPAEGEKCDLGISALALAALKGSRERRPLELLIKYLAGDPARIAFRSRLRTRHDQRANRKALTDLRPAKCEHHQAAFEEIHEI